MQIHWIFVKKKNDIEWTKLNPMKDDTDTEAAIRLAIEKGAQSITLLGATGSRIDHVLANIELLGIGLTAEGTDADCGCTQQSPDD